MHTKNLMLRVVWCLQTWIDFSGADVKGVKVGGRYLTGILRCIMKSDNVKNFDKIEIVEV